MFLLHDGCGLGGTFLGDDGEESLRAQYAANFLEQAGGVGVAFHLIGYGEEIDGIVRQGQFPGMRHYFKLRFRYCFRIFLFSAESARQFEVAGVDVQSQIVQAGLREDVAEQPAAATEVGDQSLRPGLANDIHNTAGPEHGFLLESGVVCEESPF